MSQNLNINDGNCCSASFQGLRKLTLPNGAQVGIIGLDAVMEELYAEGRKADENIASEMMTRLNAKNYFSPSSQKIYQDLFTSEYNNFCLKKTTLIKKENDPMTTQENNQNNKKKGFFGLFKGEKKTGENSCCNMKIVPKEQPAKESDKGGCCNMKIVPKEQSAEGKEVKKGNNDCDCGCCK